MVWRLFLSLETVKFALNFIQFSAVAMVTSSPSMEDLEAIDMCTRPKRLKLNTTKHYRYDNEGVGSRSLRLEDIVRLLKAYDDYDGGINCSVCGKLYKSRVCFIKHIWEHSIYWDLFAGAKNQDRVLSIQAALILYSGYHRVAMDSDNVLTHLLVTFPLPSDKKYQDDSSGDCKSPEPKRDNTSHIQVESSPLSYNRGREFSPLKSPDSKELSTLNDTVTSVKVGSARRNILSPMKKRKSFGD